MNQNNMNKKEIKALQNRIIKIEQIIMKECPMHIQMIVAELVECRLLLEEAKENKEDEMTQSEKFSRDKNNGSMQIFNTNK